MKETKVYVKELPKSCRKCVFCYDNRPYWKSTDCFLNHKELDEDEIETSRDKDCPFIDIKTHDRELVKEVCEKIKERAVNMYYAEDQEDDSIEQAIVISRNEAVDEFIDILDQIQKEAENE